ncbi:delta-sterol C-methyltransferase [Favolaschia claudopus]|uniref:Sterol 24-C-methyltransferase n=1 Tax=Favolaschia claudopus TaxID=2862362 RepID=A0AAW0D7K0_9AGAR
MADRRKRDCLVNYPTHWNKDLTKEDASNTEARVGDYQEVVKGFSDAVTQLYEYSWGESFHFCRFYKGEAFAATQARHEQYLASTSDAVSQDLRAGSRFADRGREYIEAAGLDDCITFVQGDFTKLTENFPENEYDAAYAIDATVHAPTWESVYGAIHNVLKPGGKFGVYEWCMTDRWDAPNPEHVKLQHELEYGNGIPEMLPMKTVRPALEAVGFEVEHAEDLAERNDKIRWFYPLEGNLSEAQTMGDYVRVWRLSWLGIWLTHTGVQAAKVLHVASTSLVATGKAKLFTPMYLVVSKKPASS